MARKTLTAAALVAAVLTTLAAPAALAQDTGTDTGTPVVTVTLTPAQQAELRDIAMACRADIRSLCRNIEQGEGRVLACLDANSASLRAGCQAQMGESQELLALIRAAYPQ